MGIRTILVLFLLFGSLFVYAEATLGVSVLSPNAGETLIAGTEYTITWESQNLPSKAAIGIQLANDALDEDGFWEGIANDLENTGTYVWTVPETLEENSYKIYIYTQGIGERINGISDSFEIKMSEDILEKIIEELGELNFTILLKEIKINNEIKVIHEIKIKEQSKIFGLFKVEKEIIMNIDSETGEIISIKKPWWSFLTW